MGRKQGLGETGRVARGPQRGGETVLHLETAVRAGVTAGDPPGAHGLPGRLQGVVPESRSVSSEAF